jgi:hypothetical protein
VLLLELLELLEYSWNLKFIFKDTLKALEKRKVFKNSLITP